MKTSQKQQKTENIHGHDLTTGSIPRHLIAFTVPMLAGSILQTAYSFINAIWVGKFLGKADLAAVTVSFPVVFVLMAMAGGLTLATNILISQYFGAKNHAQMRKVVQSSTALIGGLSILLFIIGEIFAPAILRAMDTPPDVLVLATSYMRVFLISLPFAFGVFLVSSMLRGIGDSTTPLYFQTASVLVSAILDPLLMFGLLGLPRMGLNGTAWSSVITQAAAVVAVFWYMQRKRSPVTPDWRHLHADWETSWHTMKIGIPSAIQQSLVSVGMVFVIGMVNGFGANATAAFGAASRLDQLAIMPAQTFGMAVSTLSGQNIGARKLARVGQTFRWGALFSAGVTLIPSLLALLVPHGLLRIFTNDPTVIRVGAEYLRTIGFAYIFFAISFVGNGVINGAGHTFITTIISLVSLWFFRVPLAYYLSKRLHSVQGIWDAMAISFAVSMVASLIYYFSGHWRKHKVIVQQLPPADPTGIVGDETGEA
ncbi:MAG TPA: MATE family efflux transporter [Armatimonadota bacterium]|nr:MATE family efflux transporter [Armatimonadota bacterium]